jgi:hypothetical protein
MRNNFVDQRGGQSQLARSTAVMDVGKHERDSAMKSELGVFEQSKKLQQRLGGDAPPSESEIKSQATRPQTRKDEDYRSVKSNDRYSKTGSRKPTRKSALNSERRPVQVFRPGDEQSKASLLTEPLAYVQNANTLGEAMHDNTLLETGKLGAQFVAHDRLIDPKLQKSLIHHGANSQSLYQFYHRDRLNSSSQSRLGLAKPFTGGPSANFP